ncbi:MAG: Wzz/FepE/Etk N-terminal domain-containing protein [Thermodesulfobacteriota bacterium]|nr:Wzz/FepE/Etk N-terminal domain-containing protein [Thermodesulfobacteriota bacterium]
MENNTEKNPNEFSFGDYWAIVKRRKSWILFPFIGILLISLIIAFALPPTYKSATTILIEGQQIPSNYVQSTVTEYVEKRLQTITQRIMSRTRLQGIIEQFHLYEEELKKVPKEEVIQRMRDSIKLNSITADVMDQRTGRPTVATIAFALSYEGRNPEKVQKVANRLASLYLEENLKTREEMAETTTSFLENELQELRQNINDQEDKIAEFKKKHADSLPDMEVMNIREIQRMERELEYLEQDLSSAKDRKIALEGQLDGINPDMPGIRGPEGKFSDPRQQLEYLQTQYTEMKASLSEKHPDLIKMKKSIDALKEVVSLNDELRLKQNQLEKLQKELAVAKSQYSNKHPDVISLKQSIEIIQQDIDERVKESNTIDDKQSTPENPAYINITTDIERMSNQIATLLAKRKTLRSRIAEYENRLAMTPRIEARFRALYRNYEDAQRRYQEVFSKLMAAKTAESLEKGQKGERFTIIDPAMFPSEPYQPNRLAIIFLGLVLSMGGGIGIAVIREISDQAIWSEKTLAQLTDNRILALIPDIETAKDRRRKKQKFIISLPLIVITGILLIVVVHFFYQPLDLLWFRLLDKLPIQ